MTSRFLTLGRSFSISALTGKYSPHRTGVPRIFFFSKTFTFKPFFDRWTAAERPPGPPPTMTTSYLLPFNCKAQLGVRPVNSDDFACTRWSGRCDIPRSICQKISQGEREDDRDLEGHYGRFKRVPEKAVSDHCDNCDNHRSRHRCCLRGNRELRLWGRNCSQLLTGSSIFLVCSVCGLVLCY